jgi:competence protein ComEC
MTLICLSLSWIAGIIIGLNFDLPAVLILTGLIPLPFLFFKRYRKQVILSGLCIAAFFGGSVCAQACLPEDDSGYIKFFNDRGTVTVTGMVSNAPDVRDSNTRLVVKASKIKLEEEWTEIEGNVLVFVSNYPAYSYGDVIQITGELKTPPVFEDFDYADYLSHENIYSTMLYPQIEVTDSGGGVLPLKWIYSLRSELSLALAKVLPEPQASLAQGMLLGIRSNIPDDLQQAFSATGTTHILAISGLNIGIVAGIMLSIGLWLFGRRHYLYIWLALGIIWIYAIITGMEAPVLRSAVMASIFLTAELLGRQRNAITALTFSAAVMVACDPQVICTASFQMSFMAMFGLIFILPPLQTLGKSFISRIPAKFPVIPTITGFIYDSLAVTLAALLGVMPLVAYYFGIVSIVSPLATLFALPVLTGIIITGMLTAIAGLFLLPLSQFFGWLLWLLLSYMILVVEGFAGLSISYVDIGSLDVIFLWIYYIALAITIWAVHRSKYLKRLENEDSRDRQANAVKTAKTEKKNFLMRRPVKIIISLAAVISILGFTALNSAPDDNLHVAFLDAGQGDAILVQKGTAQVLIDGGPGGQALSLALSEKMPFWDKTIELVVLTHPHEDHLTGLVEVLKRYKVEQVLTTETESDLPVYKEWLALIEQQNIPVLLAQAGQQMNIDGAIIDVLNPQKTYFKGTESDADNNSIVLNLAFGDISFLLTGDLRKEGEMELITGRLIQQATVLKVGHHGSASSTSPEFLNVARPQAAVISVGADNNYGHPDSEVIERLTEMAGEVNIYRTDRNGSIEFITDGEKLWAIAKHW